MPTFVTNPEEEKHVRKLQKGTAPNSTLQYGRLTTGKMERTYCFTAVCYKTRSLLKAFLEVVSKSLVFIFFGTQLKKFTYRRSTRSMRLFTQLLGQHFSGVSRYVIKKPYHAPGPLSPVLKQIQWLCFRYVQELETTQRG